MQSFRERKNQLVRPVPPVQRVKVQKKIFPKLPLGKIFLVVFVLIILISGIYYFKTNYTIEPPKSESHDITSPDYEVKLYKGLGMVDPSKTEERQFGVNDKKFVSVKAITDSNSGLRLNVYKVGSATPIQVVPLSNMKKDQFRTISLSTSLEHGVYKVEVARNETVTNSFEFTLN